MARGRLELPFGPAGIDVGDGHRLELEPEVPDTGEDAVELRVVDELSDELGSAGATHRCEAVESGGETLAQASTDSYPNRQHRSHGREAPARLRDRASRRSAFTQGDFPGLPDGLESAV
jgi:hypothetical protein